jgi:hypothetical protein
MHFFPEEEHKHEMIGYHHGLLLIMPKGHRSRHNITGIRYNQTSKHSFTIEHLFTKETGMLFWNAILSMKTLLLQPYDKVKQIIRDDLYLYTMYAVCLGTFDRVCPRSNTCSTSEKKYLDIVRLIHVEDDYTGTLVASIATGRYLKVYKFMVHNERVKLYQSPIASIIVPSRLALTASVHVLPITFGDVIILINFVDRFNGPGVGPGTHTARTHVHGYLLHRNTHKANSLLIKVTLVTGASVYQLYDPLMHRVIIKFIHKQSSNIKYFLMPCNRDLECENYWQCPIRGLDTKKEAVVSIEGEYGVRLYNHGFGYLLTFHPFKDIWVKRVVTDIYVGQKPLQLNDFAKMNRI